MSIPSHLPPRDVAVVAWPTGGTEREQLARQRVPRVLRVPFGTDPPTLMDDLEDRVQEGIDPDDLAVRARVLAERADIGRPRVDADGLLHHAGRWTAVPEGQIAVLSLVVERMDRVVAKEALKAAYVAAGGSGHPDSMRTLTSRLARRVREVGLELVTIRGRGVLLTTPPSMA